MGAGRRLSQDERDSTTESERLHEPSSVHEMGRSTWSLEIFKLSSGIGGKFEMRGNDHLSRTMSEIK